MKLEIRKYKLIKTNHIIWLLLFLLFGCEHKTSKNKRPVVIVSILPQQYFVEQIAAKLCEVIVMIPDGASPAVYEPTFEQIKTLSEAQTYFAIGDLAFEKAWMYKFQSVNPNLNVINTSIGIQRYRFGEHQEVDTHIWLSPKLVKQQTKIMLSYLQNMLPEHKQELTNNYNILMQKIDEIENKIKNELILVKNKKFMIYHPALGYFAKSFGLEQIPIEYEGKEPSVSYLIKIVDIANNNNLKNILIQKQFDVDKAKSIANELGGEVFVIDPLQYNWPEMMLNISAKLKQSAK